MKFQQTMETIFLLADDDVDDTQFFCDALEEIDPSIICYCAIDGREVFEVLQNPALKRPQVIFLDINMPGINGWECLTRLKTDVVFRHIPVIMVSTSSHQKEADIALDMGALCLFTKPTYYMELKEILKVIAANVDGNLLQAISHFNAIKTKKLFNAPDLKQTS